MVVGWQNAKKFPISGWILNQVKTILECLHLFFNDQWLKKDRPLSLSELRLISLSHSFCSLCFTQGLEIVTWSKALLPCKQWACMRQEERDQKPSNAEIIRGAGYEAVRLLLCKIYAEYCNLFRWWWGWWWTSAQGGRTTTIALTLLNVCWSSR